ncbi:tyrosine--tRNA ligase [Actinomyces sp. zg-332]|uniref:tyrosine--tRNA ligase n=1 Tax=Actinomyces sp. zg-332 TaxID=2708340 RepID=UPI0014220E61|nr:tyrosine--tRNA ligase [Actinomyces sp. zg-332]QPK93682.1 tyrosine--tRNA ligase [Actinomyces sp. zg-332]
MTDLLEELKWRGLVAQHTDIDELSKLLNEGSITFYCGFDPTAASLHHGHLVQLVLMKHLQNAGHKPIALVGGGTGLIGDPRMSGERTLNPSEIVSQWAEKLREQIGKFLSFDGDNAVRMVNNYEWISELSAINLLRDLGKHFRLGTMLAKDNVARRLKSEEGISYTEFSYQILQGNDYLELFKRYNCVLQTGGNDQWGNLVSGMDLIRKTEGKSVHVLTTPLITKSDGTKFGKSEGGAIWLNPELLSPYAFYQFWMGAEDSDVVNFLKVFTFVDRDTIAQMEEEVSQRPHLRAAQKLLAKEVTTMVHGKEECDEVINASTALWGSGDLKGINPQTLISATEQLPKGKCSIGANMVDMLVETGLEKGRSAARRTIASGGAYLNNEKVTDEDYTLTEDDLLGGQIALIRKGKRNLAVVEIQN